MASPEITALREHCNKIIKRLNDVPRNVSASTYHERVVDFDMVNGLLKKCDDVFAADDANKHQGWQLPLLPDEREMLDRCIEIIKNTRDSFLDPAYAGDPINSFQERFACNQCIAALIDEFGTPPPPEQEGGL